MLATRGVCRIVCIIPKRDATDTLLLGRGDLNCSAEFKQQIGKHRDAGAFCCGRETYKRAFPPARVYQHMWGSNRVESRLWKCHSTEKQSYLAVAGSSPLPSILSSPLHPSVFVLDLDAFSIPSVETSLNLSQLEHVLLLFFCKEHSIRRTHFILWVKNTCAIKAQKQQRGVVNSLRREREKQVCQLLVFLFL